MTSLPVSESSQILHGLDITYEELLFYGQQHLLGKRVRPSGVLCLSGLLNLRGKLLLGAVTMLLYGETPPLAF